jgi:hypothetical protein
MIPALIVPGSTMSGWLLSHLGAAIGHPCLNSTNQESETTEYEMLRIQAMYVDTLGGNIVNFISISAGYLLASYFAVMSRVRGAKKA